MHPGHTLPLHPTPDPSASLLPDITRALEWRGWKDGRIEAARRQVPILALAEPSWTNSAQRLGLILQKDAGLRQAISDTCVPVFIDPTERPDLAARWRWAAVSLGGSLGPPLMMFLTEEGRPILSYCTMSLDGESGYPSLQSLVRTLSQEYTERHDVFIREARDLDARADHAASPGSSPSDVPWRALIDNADDVYGGLLDETPKHAHPQLLLLLLDQFRRGNAEEAGAFVHKTLHKLVKGGINDQLSAGFHRCARDRRWILPHFEKPIPYNAQLAAVFATASTALQDETLGHVANELVGFCATALRREVDALASDSNYYTWTSRELLDHLHPETVQAVAFHYNLTPDPSRQVLYRALEPEAMDRYSHESPAALRARLNQGRTQLLAARLHRTPVEQIRVSLASWPAETIRWLFLASNEGCKVPIDDLEAGLERISSNLEAKTLDAMSNDDDSPHPWMGERASVLSAMVSAHHATENDMWLDRARIEADKLLATYVDGSGWLDRPAQSERSTRSLDVIDDVLPAAVATVTRSLCELCTLLNEPRYGQSALHASRHYRSLLDPGEPLMASLWVAWHEAEQLKVIDALDLATTNASTPAFV